MDIYTLEHYYGSSSYHDCPTERPFFKIDVPSSFSLNWDWNSASYYYSFKTDTLETIAGNFPEYYQVQLFGPYPQKWYFVENIGVVKYEWNPNVGFVWELISYEIN